MVKFIARNKVAGEVSDKEREAIVARQIDSLIDKYGIDYSKRVGIATNIEVFCEEQEYMGIPYLVKVIEHVRYDEPTKPLVGTMNAMGKWMVIEYDREKVGDVVDLVDELEQVLHIYEFLYKDALHSGQENMSLEEQYNWLIDWVHDDINTLFNDGIDMIREYVFKVLNTYEKILKLTIGANKNE